MTVAPLDDSVLAVLEQSPLGPIADRSVDDVLRAAGLPPLPSFTGPVVVTGHPALPGIDLPTLLKPLTDAVGSFGPGKSPGDGDPTQLLSTTGTALHGAQQLGLGALDTLSAQWQGHGSTAAQRKGQQADEDNGRIQLQGQRQQGLFTQAAALVAGGKQQINQVMEQLHQRLSQLSGSQHTVAGQAAVLAATNDANAQAARIVAHTRSQLAPLTTQMHAAGQPIPVTSAPSDLDQLPWAGSLLREGKSSGIAHGTGTSPAHGFHFGGGHSGSGGSTPGVDQDDFGQSGGVINGIAMPPLSPWATTRFAEWKPNEPDNGSAKDGAKNGNNPPPADEPHLPMGSSVLPLRAAAAVAANPQPAPATSLAGASVGWREAMVTAAHGDQMVGDLDQGSFPVVGGVEQLVAPAERKKRDRDDER